MTTDAIDEAMIDRLVRRFYGAARRDPLLGPVFEGAIDDWEAHFATLRDFWSSVMLTSGRYHGQPMRAHAPLPVDARHFDRWLAMFAEAADEVCPPAIARAFADRARRIAQSLELGIAVGRGARLRPGERLQAETSGADAP
ncbi:MAG: group III truncated hemoglobin [Alphaproteobacteria bacterium]